ncbi:hypothetical protein SDC9_91978 [bioreactor metagenome]|uniref:Uncharacterized protein n=1 Tax=bioreactor metagenome TaxID=1076179 RepID=A0A644ZWS8_9ZZZZ
MLADREWIPDKNSLSQIISGSFLLSEGGYTYLKPGIIVLMLLISLLTLLMLSIMFMPWLSINIILLWRPITSAMIDFSMLYPISSMQSKVISITRSRLGCLMVIMRLPVRCFLRSMQKAGAFIGLLLLSSVRCILGYTGLAEISNL